MNLLRNIDWRLVFKTLAACVIAPWALVYLAFVWFAPSDSSLTFGQVSLAAVVMGTTYLFAPAAAAYFSARAATTHQFAHAALTVALGTLAYVSFFDNSLFALVVWPFMGLLGFIPSFRRSQAEA